MASKIWPGLIGIGFALAGCDDPATFAMEFDGRIGTIAFHSQPIVVHVPDSMQAGEAAAVAITTYGGGCTKIGETEIQVSGLHATVTPYDSVPRASHGIACPDILVINEHSAHIVFGAAGVAEVTVRGWREPENEEITIRRDVVVQ